MRNLQAGPVVEAQVAQGLPVALHHARRRGGQFFGQFAQCALPVRQLVDFAPGLVLDGAGEFQVFFLDTEEFSV
jgi:hypothetical protein